MLLKDLLSLGAPPVVVVLCFVVAVLWRKIQFLEKEVDKMHQIYREDLKNVHKYYHEKMEDISDRYNHVITEWNHAVERMRGFRE